MKKTTWIIAPKVFEGRPGENLPNVIKVMGYDCQIMEFDKTTMSYPKPKMVDGPVVFHGPIRFVNEMKKWPLYPGALGFQLNSVAE